MHPETDPRRGLPSCSSLERLANCPASFALGKAAQAAGLEPPADPAAASGTRIHRYLETEADADFEALTNDERETAGICKSQRDRLIIEWISGSGPNVEHFKERRLGLTRMGNAIDVTPETVVELVVTGMADHIVIDRQVSRGLIMDYKTGRGEVEDAQHNAQLRGLAVLAALRWRLTDVRVAIIQPLAGAPTVADFDDRALDDAGVWLEDVCEEVHKPHDPVAGDWCQYCPARCYEQGNPKESVCPALREHATDLPVYLISGAETDIAPVIARAMDLPPDRLGRLLKGRRIINYYLASIEAAAKMRISNGEEIPGWELRDKNGRRKIADTDKAAVALTPLLTGAEGGAQAALLRCATLRPKALQEEIQFASGKKNARLYNMTQKDAKQHLANALGDLLEVPTHKELVETGAALTYGDGEEGE